MIKYIFVISLISISLFGRLNPFEPADGTLETNTPRPVTNLNSEDDGTRTVKIVNDGKVEQQIPKKEIQKPKAIENISKEEIKQPPKETIKTISKEDLTNKIEESVAKQPIKTEKTKIDKKIVSTPIKKVKKVKKKVKKVAKNSNKKVLQQKTSSTVKRYNVLPLLTIDLVDKNLIIKITNNYKIIKYYEDQPNNKFVFDFKANLGIPTAKEVLESSYYESYTVGNHPEEGFFRVVIPVKESTANYKVTIKNNVGTITRN